MNLQARGVLGTNVTDTPIQPKTGSYMKARPKGYRSRETQKLMAENTEAYLTPEDIPCSSGHK